ncbi:MAG: 50S ribosomal protein L9 [Henriciella sp.]|jgi:large subunit ribosomal protein L9|uniref:50S ribosomal protein L9 n=1 Tax=Henriciella sp. TaxID=1968823 RepID=UPI000C0D4C8F|nr:50S ribosomal protein L9 [Henriciella sp.]MAN73088.1 50S ribosomal protein L9 [Henriciella sp.]MBF35361.1 50S ribosomal protein L9 [Hyphomonadaceae bacterium]PHR79343.1 MAG: 50S ribosomal protein L9 [Henriciella sp.]|tara:strand:+ start:2210 stop:2803 length:594 start_codon:yes stop_codon:yes gene_type:complete
MDIILLERVENLGELGEEVTVKNGFARNFLLPRGKALIANDRNRARFAAERDIIEKRNADARAEAQQTGDSLDGTELVLIRQSSDTGNLYGSVSTRDIVDALDEKGFKVRRGQIKLDQPIKTIGIYEMGVRLHAEVLVDISVNVARSMEEAERQAAGENVIETIQAEQQGAAAEQSAELAEASAEREEETREAPEEE